MESKIYDVIVVGGGAAGLMAAGTAAEQGKSVFLMEKMEKTGRKVRISGKGRCNLTNTREYDSFVEKITTNREFVEPAFRAFDNRATMRFFERHGVRLETEQGGRVFPKSGKAWDVAQALVDWCRESGVTIECNARAERIVVVAGRVLGVDYRNRRNFVRRVEAPAVILCTGGASYPATGSTGDGYRMAFDTGHHIVEIRPSLVPLESDYSEIPFMRGLLLRNINARLLVDSECVAEEFGEMSFTDRGVEGAVVLRMSHQAVDALIDGHKVEIAIDLKHAMDDEELKQRIRREVADQPADITAGELLRKIVPRELVVPVAKRTGMNVRQRANMTDQKIDELAAVLKNFTIHISDYRPFEQAIVTAGGVDVAQIDPATMESRVVGGLYFAGELIDIDANTGGYNMQMAFSTGRLAAQLKHNSDE